MKQVFREVNPHDFFSPKFGMVLQLPPPTVGGPEAGWLTKLSPAYVPKGLEELHDPAVISGMWRRLLEAVREPVETVRIGDHCYVYVVGCVVIDVRPNGELHSHQWVDGGQGISRMVASSAWNVAVQGMPWRDLWLGQLANQAAYEVLAKAESLGSASPLQLARAYTGWAFAMFARRLKGCADLREMRRRIADALATDSKVVRAAGRIPRIGRPVAVVTLGAYNRVIRHLEAFEQIEEESPHLISVFGALCDEFDFPVEGDPVSRLKRYLRNQGLSQRLWRLVAHSNGRLLIPLKEFYCGNAHLAEPALDHLRLLDLLNIQRQPPPWFIEVLLSGWGSITNQRHSYLEEAAPALDEWRHVARLVCAGKESGSKNIPPTDFALVQQWLLRRDCHKVLDKRRRKAGWQWLVRQAKAWRKHEQLKLSSRTWYVPFDGLRVLQHDFIALTSVLHLWEEATTMRHCVEDYEQACREGVSVILSVRRCGKRVATVDLARGLDGWEVRHIAGFANRIADRMAAAATQAMIRVISRVPQQPVQGQAQLEASGVGRSGESDIVIAVDDGPVNDGANTNITATRFDHT